MLGNQKITLDGHSAKMRSDKNPTAIIYRSDGIGGDVEFSWEAAKRIIHKGGNFKS